MSIWDNPPKPQQAVDVWGNNAWSGKPTAINVDNDIPMDKGPGRPTKYKPEYDEVARKLCELGATDFELAQHFEINKTTIYYWQAHNPSFREACVLGKEGPDTRMEASLYHRGIGYSFAARKFFNNDGQITVVDYVEHVPPDTKAAHIWLLNRRPDKWREKVELAGRDGGPIQLQITATDANL